MVMFTDAIVIMRMKIIPKLTLATPYILAPPPPTEFSSMFGTFSLLRSRMLRLFWTLSMYFWLWHFLHHGFLAN